MRDEVERRKGEKGGKRKEMGKKEDSCTNTASQRRTKLRESREKAKIGER
jgi:hypothetical protein